MDSLGSVVSNLSSYSFQSKSSTAHAELSCTRVSDRCEKLYMKKDSPHEHQQKIAATSLPERVVSIPGSAARTFEDLFKKARDGGFSQIHVHAGLTHILVKGGNKNEIDCHGFEEIEESLRIKQLKEIARKYKLIPDDYALQTEFQRKGFMTVWKQVSLYDEFIHDRKNTFQLMHGTAKFFEYLDKYELELKPNELSPKKWLTSLYIASLEPGDRFAHLCRLWTECSHLTAVNDNVCQVTVSSVNSDKYTYDFNWDDLRNFLPVRMVVNSFVNNKCSRSLRSNRFCAAPVSADFIRHEPGKNNSGYPIKRKIANDFMVRDDSKRLRDSYDFVCKPMPDGLKVVISRLSYPVEADLSKIGKESVLLSRCDANANSSYPADVQDPIPRGHLMMPHTAHAPSPADNFCIDGGEQSDSGISLSDSSSIERSSNNRVGLNTVHLIDTQNPEETAQVNTSTCGKKVVYRSASVVAAADSTQDMLSDDDVSKDSEPEVYSGEAVISNADEMAPLSDNNVGKGFESQESSDEVAASFADKTAHPVDHHLLQENSVSAISQEESKPGLSLDAALVLANSSDLSGGKKGSSSDDVLVTADQFYSIAKILEGNGFPPFIRVNPQLVDLCSRLSLNGVAPETGLELRDESGQLASVEKGSDSDLSSQVVEPDLYSRLSSNGGVRGTGIELSNETGQCTPVERPLDSNILFQSAEQSLSSCATGSNIIGTQRAVPMPGLAEMFDLDPLLSSSGERSRRPSIQYHRNLSYSYSVSMNASCTVTQDTDIPENRAQAATQPLTPAVGNSERVDVGKDPLFSSGALPTEGLGPFDDGELSPLGLLPLGL